MAAKPHPRFMKMFNQLNSRFGICDANPTYDRKYVPYSDSTLV